MTPVTGGRTEQNLGIEACVPVRVCENKVQKGSLSFFVSASPLFLALCLTASAKQCTWRLRGFGRVCVEVLQKELVVGKFWKGEKKKAGSTQAFLLIRGNIPDAFLH